MPDHAVWCEVAVAEARHLPPGPAELLRRRTLHDRLERLFAALPPLPLLELQADGSPRRPERSGEAGEVGRLAELCGASHASPSQKANGSTG